jgi:hypothetical protein
MRSKLTQNTDDFTPVNVEDDLLVLVDQKISSYLTVGIAHILRQLYGFILRYSHVFIPK